jgi:hypothetical protein
LSAKQEKAVTLLRTELRDGSVPVAVLLQKALTLGLNRDYLKNAKRALGVVAIRDRDPQTARTIRWRWSMPTPKPSLPPHIWGLYSYNTEGQFFFLRTHAAMFKTFALDAFDPPLWVLLVTDAALVLPLRIAEKEVAALGGRWKRLELPARKGVRRKPKTT